MPTASVLTVIVGVSGFLGLLSLLAYLLFLFKLRQLERSVRQTLEGEGLFNAQQIVKILEQFKDDHASRLKAIREFANVDRGKAEAILEKVKDNVDVGQLERLSSSKFRWAASALSVFFFAVAVLGFGYSRLRIVDPEPPKPVQGELPAVKDAKWSMTMRLPEGWVTSYCPCAHATVLPVPNVPFQKNSFFEFPNRCDKQVEVAVAKLEPSSEGPMPMVDRTVLSPGSVLKGDVGGAVGLTFVIRSCPQ